NLLQISSIVAHHLPVRKGDPNRGNPCTKFRTLGIGRPKVKEVAPLPRILGSPHLAGGSVHNSELPVPEQPTVGHFRGVQLLSHHRLHRIPPKRHHRTSPGLPYRGRRRIGLHNLLTDSPWDGRRLGWVPVLRPVAVGSSL